MLHYHSCHTCLFDEIQNILLLTPDLFFVQPQDRSICKLLTLKVPAGVVLQEINAAVGFNNLVKEMPCSLIDLSMILRDLGMGSYLAIRCTCEWFDVFCVCGASFEVLQPSQALKIQNPPS